MTRHLATSAVAMAALATPVGAQQHRAIADLDIAGIRLGAAPAEAKAAVLKAGYRIEGTSPAPSFDDGVRREAANRQGKPLPTARWDATSDMTATGPHQEQLQVTFAQTPQGSKVRQVHLRIERENMTEDAFRRQVLTRYGQPDAIKSIGTVLSWCSPEVRQVCGQSYVVNGPLDDAYPNLRATIGISDTLVLQSGAIDDKELRREREAAVQRLAPKTGAAAF